MPRNVYIQSYLTPDSGLLKRSQHEWQNLQNLRGWGELISRRRGVRNSRIFTSGVMGIHDLLVDNDPTSLDRVLVTLNDGSLVFLTNDEIFVAFNYLFTGTAQLALQSPDLNWWNITPNSSGMLTPTVIATPSSTISIDLNLGVNDLFGFQSSTVIYRLNVNNSGSPVTTSYNLAATETEYTTTQAFTTGFGPVFTSGNLTRFRLSCDNSGTLKTTVL